MILIKLITECERLKQGDTEFILQHFNHGWVAGIGNPSWGVTLGEAAPEFSASAVTAEAAVSRLLDKLKACDGKLPDPPDTRTEAERRFDAYLDDLTDRELSHFFVALSCAYPGEILAGVIRTSAIMAATIAAPKLEIPARSTPMKLADRYTVEALASRRHELLQAIEFTTEGYTGNGVAVLVQLKYQSEATMTRARPALHKVFKAELAMLDAQLAEMGVEP